MKIVLLAVTCLITGWIVLPDGSEVVTVCDHGNRIYRNPHSGSDVPVTIVAADPTCTEVAQ